MNASFQLLQSLLVFGAGMLGAFGSSAPLGVINLWVTDKTLAHSENKLRPFLAGVIVADVFFAALAFWGYHAYLQEGTQGAILGVIGGLFLMILGIMNLRGARKSPASLNVPDPKLQAYIGRHPVRDFALGCFMVLSNPAFLMFWVFAIKFVEEHLSHAMDLHREVYFLSGIAVGDVLWFWLLIALVRRSRSAFQPRFVKSIRIAIAIAFILFGAGAIYRSTHTLTLWSRVPKWHSQSWL